MPLPVRPIPASFTTAGRSFAAIVLAGTIGAGAAAQESKPSKLFDPQPVPAAVQSFVPTGSSVTIYVQKPNQLIDSIKHIANAIQPGSGGMINFDTFSDIIDLGVRGRDLDLNLPMVATFDKDSPLAIIAGADDAASVAELADRDAIASGNFLALKMNNDGDSIELKAAPGRTSLAGMPQADVVIRVDLGAMHDEIEEAWELFQDMMQQTPNSDAVLAVYGPLFDAALEGGMVDLLANFDGHNFQWSALRELGAPPEAVKTAAKSESSASLGDLVERVVADEKAWIFGAGDVMPEFVKLFDYGKLFATLPGEKEEVAHALTATMEELYRRLDGPSAGHFTITPDGIQASYIVAASNPAATRRAIENYGAVFVDAGMGGIETQKTIDVDGVAVSYVEATYDIKNLPGMEAMFEDSAIAGEADAIAEMISKLYGNPLRVAMAEVDGRLVATLGIPPEKLAPVIAAAKEGGRSHKLAGTSLARMPSGGEQLGFLHMDIADVYRSMMPIIEATQGMQLMPAVNDDDVAPVWMGLSRDGNLYRGDFGMDVVALVKMFM